MTTRFLDSLVLVLKIYLTYKDFGEPENQIRKAESAPNITWLRNLSQEKFLEFLNKLEERKKEE